MEQNYWQMTTVEQKIKVKEYRIEKLRKQIADMEAKIAQHQSELNALYREKRQAGHSRRISVHRSSKCRQ